MDDADGGNRRGATRAPLELEVTYKRLNTFFADYTKNVSKGGAFIRTDRPLAIGTEFVFSLVLPTLDEPLRLCGRVQWVTYPDATGADRPAGMGVEFVYRNDDERRTVEDLVATLMTKELGGALAAKLLARR